MLEWEIDPAPGENPDRSEALCVFATWRELVIWSRDSDQSQTNLAHLYSPDRITHRAMQTPRADLRCLAGKFQTRSVPPRAPRARVARNHAGARTASRLIDGNSLQGRRGGAETGERGFRIDAASLLRQGDHAGGQLSC